MVRSARGWAGVSLPAPRSQGEWTVPCCGSLLSEPVTGGLGGICKTFYEPASEVRQHHYRHVIMVKNSDSHITHGERTTQSMNTGKVRAPGAIFGEALHSS